MMRIFWSIFGFRIKESDLSGFMRFNFVCIGFLSFGFRFGVSRSASTGLILVLRIGMSESIIFILFWYLLGLFGWYNFNYFFLVVLLKMLKVDKLFVKDDLNFIVVSVVNFLLGELFIARMSCWYMFVNGIVIFLMVLLVLNKFLLYVEICKVFWVIGSLNLKMFLKLKLFRLFVAN